VMGMGLAASGEMYFVKMVTASLSIPETQTTPHNQPAVLVRYPSGLRAVSFQYNEQ
jgi:hypothetical protein